jgi:tetratricopeptide (TPR) repeat protein
MSSPISAVVASPSQRRPLSFAKKLLFSLLVTLLLLGGIEFLLAMLGVKPRYLTSDPFVGFDRGSPLFVPRAEGEILRTNPVKLAYFNDQQFSTKKTAKTYRIFSVGGSTTFGHPYHDATSFTGWLRARLKDADPDRDWQVVNCGGVSYASYRICHLMQELAQYEPDLFIFYEGHNEFLEDRTYAGLKHRSSMQKLADSVLSRTRVGTSFERILRGNPKSGNRMSAEVEAILDKSVGPASYHYDPQRSKDVLEHFHASLDRACAIARSAGAQILFVKPAGNVRDFSPFKSESGQLDETTSTQWQELVTQGRQATAAAQFDTAATAFVAAAKRDPRHALTQWEAGNALFQAGQVAEAREFFLRGIDEDVCPLRATSAIRQAVTDAAVRNGVPWVDFPRLIEDELDGVVHHRIPGDESFLDHVHPTVEQHQRLAWALYEQLARLGIAPPSKPDPDLIERVSQTVMAGVDPKQHAIALVQVIQILSWAGKDQEALRLTDRAEAIQPGLSEVSSYRGRLWEKLGDTDQAFECFVEAVRRNPKDSLAMYRMGLGLLRRQNYDAAKSCFENAIKETPVQAPVMFQFGLHMGLGASWMGLERWTQAATEFRKALALSPGATDATSALEQALKQTRVPR